MLKLDFKCIGDCTRHQKAISKICDNAVAEDKLEQKMKHIEEEWAEQV